jgi:hypothetical protein
MTKKVRDPNKVNMDFLKGDNKKAINELNSRGSEFGDRVGRNIKRSMDEVGK